MTDGVRWTDVLMGPSAYSACLGLAAEVACPTKTRTLPHERCWRSRDLQSWAIERLGDGSSTFGEELFTPY
jgi:hypothetical protein